MIRKLVIFTAATFLLYFTCGVVGYLFFRTFVSQYFVFTFSTATAIFALANFWYYYTVIIGPANKTNKEYADMLKEKQNDLTKQYNLPGFIEPVKSFFKG